MADLTFLALENPLGLLGTKIKDVIQDEARLAPLAKLKKDALPGDYMVHDFQKPGKDPSKYLKRYDRMVGDDKDTARRNSALPKGTKPSPLILPTFVEDVFDNKELLLKLLRNKADYPDLRVAMCSSLKSTVKYIQTYITANPADQFDTLILYGHGSPGAINMGTSKWSIGEVITDNTDKKYETRKYYRGMFGLDKPETDPTLPPQSLRVRSLSSNTEEYFTRKFEKRYDRACFVENFKTKHFHIFLMGCEVGAKKQTFTQELAESIAKIGLTVCVSAPKQEIQPHHLEDLLRQLRLGDVRQKCADREKCKLDGNVTVVSAVASP
jgi:hypothetical protein